ncbi:thioredoxin family protein [Bacillus sp. 165]|uniref:thioredoxin family protein n=1 Tax=Bacillus sp. 165 TaxID=1529117 RepID=UPI001ADCEDB9|nr:thioredoxin family protein [Bacillus sp. 165]MBO9131233.1 thioredoxin family protein [Bacillus sp. 165]
MKKIESVEQFHEIKQEENVIFLFSADWCPDCRFIDPFMPEVIEKYKDCSFYYIDRDKFIDLCIELDVFGIPSFIAYNKGSEIGRYVNKDRKTQEEIEEFIENLK